MEAVKEIPEDLLDKFRSKRDLYTIIENQVDSNYSANFNLIMTPKYGCWSPKSANACYLLRIQASLIADYGE